MRMQNGFLVDTMTQHSQTNVTLPCTYSNPIVRMSRSELVIWDDGNKHEVVFRRQK